MKTCVVTSKEYEGTRGWGDWCRKWQIYLATIFRCAVASLQEVVSVRPSVGPSVPCYFRTRTRRILCRVSGLVSSLSVRLSVGPFVTHKLKLSNGITKQNLDKRTQGTIPQLQ